MRKTISSANQHKLLLPFFLTFCLILHMTLTFPLTVLAADTIKITDTNVNVRSGPGTSYSVLGRVQTGDTFPLLSAVPQNSFYKISYNGQTAYVHQDFASVVSEEMPDPAGTLKITDTNVNVRSGPGTSYSILGKVQTGDTFPLLSASPQNSFYKINYNNQIAYVHQDYAAPVIDNPVLLVTDNHVNIRSGPGTSYSILGTAYVSCTFPLLSSVPQSSFYKITYNGQTAYIHQNYSRPLVSSSMGIGKFIQIRLSGEIVRTQPNPDASSAGTLSFGSILEMAELTAYTHSSSGEINVFFKVVYNGAYGYVHTQYADIIETFPAPPVFSNYSVYVRNITNILNVRSGPGTSYPVIGKSDRGDVFPYKGESNGFYQIEYNGGTAYVSKDFSEIISPPDRPALDKNVVWAAVVSKKDQTVSVYEGGTLRWFSSCSTGAPGASTETPEGIFIVDYKMEYFRSGSRKQLTCFDSLRFFDEILFHRIPRNEDGSYSGFKEYLGQKASSGCVRLPEATSRWMYSNFPAKGTVVVF